MALTRRLIRTLANAKGRIPCPGCGEVNPVARDQEVVTCRKCGFRGSVTGWALQKSGAGDEPARVDPDQPPEGTKIKRKAPHLGTVAWEVPPSGKSGGMLFFAVLWTGFTAFWTVGASLGVSNSDEPGAVLFPLFSIPFWAAGIGMLYYALRGKYAWHLILVDSRSIVMARSFFKRTTRKSLSRKNLTSIEKKEFYQQNYTPVYGIEIRGREGKLRFGTTLTEEEKNWLVADLRRVVWPDRQDGSRGKRTTLPATAEPPKGMRAQSFAVDFPLARADGSLAGMIIGFLVVGGFLAIGIFVIKDAGFFRWLWLTFNGLFATAMIAGAWTRWRNRNRVIRVRGDRVGVYLETLEQRRVINRITVPEPDSLTVASYPAGSVNNTTMVRIELVGESKVTDVVKWYPGDSAQEPLAELRRALGHG